MQIVNQKVSVQPCTHRIHALSVIHLAGHHDTSRIEHDLLGDRDVPGDAYWGVHTLRAVENFPITGIRSPPTRTW